MTSGPGYRRTTFFGTDLVPDFDDHGRMGWEPLKKTCQIQEAILVSQESVKQYTAHVFAQSSGSVKMLDLT